MLLALTFGAYLRMRRLLDRDVATVAAAAYVTLAATLTGLAAGAVGIPLLGSRWWGSLVLVGWAAVLVRLTRSQDGGLTQGIQIGWIPWVPVALVVVAAALHSAFSVLPERWIALSTDPAAHAWLVGEIRATGGIDFSTTYPQGLHALAAFAETLAGRHLDSVGQLQMMAVLGCLTYALLMLSLTSVTLRLVSSVAPGAAMWCGLATGVSMLAMNGFVKQMVIPTAHSTMLGFALLFLPFLLIGRTSISDAWRPHLFIAVALVGLEANLWPPLAIPAAVIVITIGLARFRARNAWPVSRRELVELAAAAGLSGALLALPVSSVLHVSGETSSLVGPFYLPQRLLPLFCGFGLVWAVIRSKRSTQEAVAFWTLSGLMLMWVAVLATTADPADLQQYYPMKCLWILIAATLPSSWSGCATLGGQGWRRLIAKIDGLGDRAPSARIVVGSLIAMAVVVGLGRDIWQYQSSSVQVSTPFRDTTTGSLSELRIRLATKWGTRFEPRRTVAIALPFNRRLPRLSAPQVPMIIRIDTGQPPVRGSVQYICRQIQVSSDGHGTVVVTGAPLALVKRQMRAEGCAGRAPVVSASS